jgi:hypothetical protein
VQFLRPEAGLLALGLHVANFAKELVETVKIKMVPLPNDLKNPTCLIPHDTFCLCM